MKTNSRRFAHLSPDYDETAAIQEDWANAFAKVAAEQSPPGDPVSMSWDAALQRAGVATRRSANQMTPRRPGGSSDEGPKLIRTSQRGSPL